MFKMVIIQDIDKSVTERNIEEKAKEEAERRKNANNNK